MKIALIGTRGVPANYSGFETCVEQLGQRLAARGHQVTVYCRSQYISYAQPIYKGMRLIKLPTIKNKYLDTFFHTLISSLHALTQGYDIGLYFIVGNSPFVWIPRIVGTKTIIQVDGLDWKRAKWPAPAKKYLQFSEWLATKLPNVCITDSHVVQTYYQEKYHAALPNIPYGSDVEIRAPGPILQQYGLEPQKYILFVGRLVPENCAHHLVDAFRQIETDVKCVIVGGAEYADEYINSLKAKALGDERIIFTGYVFGEGYHELGSNALIFVESSGVGGTHPALVEAMAHGSCVVVHNTPENMETIGDAGFGYDGQQGAQDLARVLIELLQHPGRIIEYASKAQMRANMVYTWEAITDAYVELFEKLLEK
jgi:glycosyltransferase involved in cell wall biosynthesis